MDKPFSSSQKKVDENSIACEIGDFLYELSKEGERSAVVLGAERLHVALESLLRHFLLPSPNTEDKLFASESAALGTFSRKIEICYRLGLIDLHFKQALDLIRKLRNDFAHAVKVESLQDNQHTARVQALTQLMAKGNKSQLSKLHIPFNKSKKQTRNYLSCVMLLLVKLEITKLYRRPLESCLPENLN